jgi:hypothetical protein
MTLWVACVALACAGARAACAAPDSLSTADTCTYRRCALAVVPSWNGLDLVRGESGEHVAQLGFFWTHDLSPMFADQPQALAYAENAVRTRRIAAVLTDVGAVLLATAIIGGLADSDHADTYRGLAISGALSFGIGVPFQFAADGHLSRAVWWHNTRFAR